VSKKPFRKGSKEQEAGSKEQEAGSKEQEAGSKEQEASLGTALGRTHSNLFHYGCRHLAQGRGAQTQ